MAAVISAGWASMDPLMQGLKLGGLMNQAMEQDDTYRQGRHHFMTAINQILEWGLALEQVTRYVRAANLNYSLTGWNVARIVVPLGVAYLASRQIKVLYINQIANFVQTHWNKVSFVALTAASIGLFILGQTILAVTTLAYLSVGVLNRYNLLSPSVQKVIHQADFFIGNLTGIYLGGNFVRVICTLNLVIAAVQKYFEYKRLVAEEEKKTEELAHPQASKIVDDIEEESEDEFPVSISLDELAILENDILCPMRKSHVHKKPLPSVDESIQIDDLLDLYEEIDWSKHEHVLKSKLAKDKRWLEVGQFESEPLEYFERNLRHLIESIKNRDILEGKPASYDMLEFYCRFIAQELKEQDGMTQADMLMWMGVEGGEYCGSGKFGAIEEIYENLLSQASGLPLETRVLACEQQERQRVWQNIYQLIWRSNPLTQLFGYMSDVNAIHNGNVFINLVQAGEKFGIPHQAAKNDLTATINPVSHYLAVAFVDQIEQCFWEGGYIPQCYISIETPPIASDWWKCWKWIHLKNEDIYAVPYDGKTIFKRLSETIGSPQIPKMDIYAWWMQWIDRQDDLTDEKKEELSDELQAMPKKDEKGKFLPITFNGEPFEVDGKIQPKFLKAMLIEMGILDKPWKLRSDVELDYDEDELEIEK
jgi:hypothetical protein